MFPLDSSTSGVRFHGVTADVEDDRIHLHGVYNASDLLPVLLFSVGVPWIEPSCVRHVCCLWEVAERYRDHGLLSALGSSTCDEGANLTSKDLMKGNPPNSGSWEVRTMIHPSFVAMLFVAQKAFYMYHEVVPLRWTESSTVRWRSSWYGQPCHSVDYEGRRVCIHCANSKPDNADFVFGADWFATFQCPWTCKEGYMGPNCSVQTNVLVYAGIGVVCALCIIGLALCAFYGPRRKSQNTTVVIGGGNGNSNASAAKVSSEIIVFRDDILPDIRIKLL